MDDEGLRYDRLVEMGLRSVMRNALKLVAEHGLPNEHHFYISFISDFPGVQLPDRLRQQYPEEMTIVLQFQFFNLRVEEDFFSVTLSFNNIRENLVIPFQAVTSFSDPSVNFVLQFQTVEDDEELPEAEPETKTQKKPVDDGKRGEVISLDMFRNNNKKT
jgi:uncharacterized protein